MEGQKMNAPTAKIIRLGDSAYITVVMNRETLTIRKNDDENTFNNALDCLRNENWDMLYQTMRPVRSFASKMEGLTISKEGVMFNGKPLHNTVCTRILEFAQNGLPHEPLCNFLIRLMKNPSKRAVDELYTFLEHKNLPVTSLGTFLAYKGITNDEYSVTSGKVTLLKGKEENGRIYNGIGEEIEIPRNEVNDDKDVHCSHGLHAGTIEYASNFGPRVVIVEIDPADVVSIPNDCNCQKLRCCHYKVVDECKGALDKPLYDSKWKDSEDSFEPDVEEDHCYDSMSFSTPDSSWIEKIWWEPDGSMEVGLYTRSIFYKDVPRSVVEDWEEDYNNGNSAGEFYNKYIRDEYTLD